MKLSCPKCDKAVIKRKTTPKLNYWTCHCLWCGFDFRKAKTHVRVKERRRIEGGN
jgi:ribosomal protein L37AE/L43A